MPKLSWSADFVLGLPAMDDTHREFVDLLAAVQTAPDDRLPARWAVLVDHTDDHFSREDGWMRATRFASSNCHSMQHKMVLQVMRDGIKRAQAGELSVVRQMAAELAVWFPQHADAMDAALALHLSRVGFDPATGLMSRPDALPDDLIHGCGGVSCSEPTTQTATETAEATA